LVVGADAGGEAFATDPDPPRLIVMPRLLSLRDMKSLKVE